MLSLRAGIKATSELKQSISLAEAEAMMAHTTFSSHYTSHRSIHHQEMIDLGFVAHWE